MRRVDRTEPDWYAEKRYRQLERMLAEDGRPDLAAEYKEKRLALPMNFPLRDLGEAIEAARFGRGSDPFLIGAEVADWLLEHGWTPPKDIITITYEATDPTIEGAL